MADCDDRQLSEAQRQAGYQNQRTGVGQALRPFSGRPTLDNLLDYINRELVPAVRRTRSAVNDIYLPAVENAPSANPLIYYFAADTTAADPTAGRIRLDASPQNTATVVRVSEQNARLVDATPWLEVMAGGSTSPLGVITLSDAINPGRFIRFDLSSMVDQGDYWDLGVSAIESSHDDPFVDGGGLVVSFIPGVASGGTTVPPGTLTPIGANTVIGNPTASTAAPTEIAVGADTVLGRKSGNIVAEQVSTAQIEDDAVTNAKIRNSSALSVIGRSTNTSGDPADIAIPTTTGGRFLRTNTTGFPSTNPVAPSVIGWGVITLLDLPVLLNNRFLANVSGADASPVGVDFYFVADGSRGIEYDPVDQVYFAKLGNTLFTHTDGTINREAISGDVVIDQFSNTATIQADVVTDAKLRDSAALSVIGRAANSAGDPADISTTSGSNAVLRESGGTLGFGTIATGGLADAAVTNAKLANVAAGTQKGRQIDGGTGVPVDLTGSEQGENLRLGLREDLAPAPGTVNDQVIDARTKVLRVNPSSDGDVVYTGFAMGSSNTDGFFLLMKLGGDGRVTLRNEDAGSTAANRLLCPLGQDFVLDQSNSTAWVFYQAGRWSVVGGQPYTASFINLTPSGSLGTVDISALQHEGTLFVQPTGNFDISGFTAKGTGFEFSLIYRDATTHTGTLNDEVTATTSTERINNPGSLALTFTRREAIRFKYASSRWKVISTTGVPVGSITNAKLANMTEGTIKGRAIGAGTGAPQDLTGQQAGGVLRYAPIIDTASTGTITSYAPTGFDASTTNIRITPASDVVLRGMALANGQQVSIRLGRTAGFTVTINHEDASAAATSERFNCPSNANLVLRAGEGCIIRNGESRNNVIATGKSSVTDADYGDVTVSTNGTLWTIDNNVVSDAKLRDSGAVSVIGRAANSSGDPADISAAANDRLLARTSDSLAFQQLSDGMVAANTIGLSKLANVADNRFLGNISGATGAVTAVDFGSLNSNTIIYESTGKTLIRQALTGDVTALQNSNATTIANSAVTLAKMADLAQSRIIGRAESAGTGAPTALTPTQVVSIIDGESATWTGAHNFTGATHSVVVSGAAQFLSSGGTCQVAGTGATSVGSASSTLTLVGGTQLILAAANTIDANSPTQLQSSLALTSVLTSSATAANNLTLGTVSVVRFTGPVDPLTGMVPTASGQVVLLVNAHASVNMGILIEATGSSSAANCFAGTGTSRVIRPGELALAWYDGSSSRWRLLCRDEIDL